VADDNTDFAAMAAPVDAHGRLADFVGTFRAEVKMWMGPGEPAVTTGTMVNEVDLGGRFLRQTYTGDDSEGPFPNFEGRGYWGFNKVTGKYEGFWIDNASTVMQFEAGDVDEAGQVWTMVGELPDPRTGGTMTRRTVITVEDGDHHTMEMFFAGDEGENKGMEIRYSRAG